MNRSITFAVLVVLITISALNCKDTSNQNTNINIKKIICTNELTGKWYGATEYQKIAYTPELDIPASIFDIGRSGFGDIEIDPSGRSHVHFARSYKTYPPPPDPIYYVISDKCRWFTLENQPTKVLNSHPYLPNSPKGVEIPGRFRLDSKNRSHFMGWSEEGLVYLIWNGNGWETIDSEKLENETSTRIEIQHPHKSWQPLDFDVALDSNDAPHIVYYDTSMEEDGHVYIHYLYWNGSSWITANGNRYDDDTNNGAICAVKKRNQLDLMLDSNDNPTIIWSEEEYPNLIYIKGVVRNTNEWESVLSSNEGSNIIVDLRGKSFYSSIYDFHVTIDMYDNLHLAWEYKENDEAPRTYCYMFNKSSNWYNYKGEVIAEDLSNAVVPVSIDHIDDKGYLHHVGYANDDFDLYHTMWNGQQWTSIEGRPTPPEGDEDCIFYRNYNDRPPGDFIIRTHKNNFYIAWNQWSQEGVGVGVCANLHYMEWIEDTEAK